MIETYSIHDPLGSACQTLIDHFRCPPEFSRFTSSVVESTPFGFFRLGSDTICYGQCSSGKPSGAVTDALRDVLPSIIVGNSPVELPFDPAQVLDNLRAERYLTSESSAARDIINRLYYLVRPLMPVSVRRHLQHLYLREWDKIAFPSWPVDVTVDRLFESLLALSMKAQKQTRVPFIWFWPEGASNCAIVSHDVETGQGMDFCPTLMDLNDSFGIKTSFQIVPEKRYSVHRKFLELIRARGFEVNVHDFNHDGHLFRDRQEFVRRAEFINRYAREWGAVGFRSAVLYRKPDWLDALHFSYDMSFPNVAHLDPQRGGCCTVMPFFIKTLVELPVTLTQDYTLFNILKQSSIQLWKDQISLIRAKHGLISAIVHPDYVIDESPRRVYAELLGYLSELRDHHETWIALPKEVASWWKLRNELQLVKNRGSWRIEGNGSERARLAYAILGEDGITYERQE